MIVGAGHPTRAAMKTVLPFLLLIILVGTIGCSSVRWTQRDAGLAMIEGGGASKVVVATGDSTVTVRNASLRRDTLLGRTRRSGRDVPASIAVRDIDSLAIRVPNRSTSRIVAVSAIAAAALFLISLPDMVIKLP
jgi:hypothetical protein